MDDVRSRSRLAAEQLRRTTNPADLKFETTASLPAPQRMVGQERAEEAITLALGMRNSHYNLFVAGHPGSGRREGVMLALEPASRVLPAAQDWCYVHNFEQPEEPRAVALPAGMGRQFARDVASYVRACRVEFRRAFNTATYLRERERIVHTLHEQRDALLDAVRAQASAMGFALRETQEGINIVALRPAAERQPAVDAPVGIPADATNPETEATVPEAYSREDFLALPLQEQDAIRERREQLEALLDAVLAQVRTLENEARAQLRSLQRAVAEQASAAITEARLARYAVAADAVDFLKRVRADLVAYASILRADSDAAPASKQKNEDTTTTGTSGDAAGDAAGVASADAQDDHGNQDGTGTPLSNDVAGDESGDEAVGDEEIGDETDDMDAADTDEDEGTEEGSGSSAEEAALQALLRQYRVNVLVTHKPSEHAPIVEETTPSRVNLLGRIEVATRRGAQYTDHMMIKAGALHRANGGFLVVQARDVLQHKGAWDTIKRTIRFGTIKTESSPETTGVSSSATLRPEPILATIKVILIGDRRTYLALAEADPEFREFFKVRADFDSEMVRTPANEMAYAQYAGRVASDTGGPPLTADAVALVIDEGSRWAEDQERLSAIFGDVHDLTAEACYWAREEMSHLTTRAHVARAIRARDHRLRLHADKTHESIADGSVSITTDGEVVGQINGLVIRTLLGYSFGFPVRIIARTAPGVGGIVNTERESDMSGSTHSKGVFILSGYLLGRYGQEMPLTLSASIGMEQEYVEVDGDSASSTELYALLSCLANAPIRQGIAVTGSVNQRGEVQAVGSVTEKIEGFFDLCAARGLTGQQGVIIPRTNVRNLMLKEAVVEAVRAGKFSIYAVSTIDEGMEILTHIPAGTPHPDNGAYLAGTLSDRILQTLRGYAEKVRAHGLTPAYANRLVQ